MRILTLEDIDKQLFLLNRSAGKSISSFSIYTGIRGMHDAYLAMWSHHNGGKCSLNFLGKVHISYSCRKIRGVYVVSLFEKHGRFKVIIDLRRKSFPIRFMDGTKEVYQSNNTDSVNSVIAHYTLKHRVDIQNTN